MTIGGRLYRLFFYLKLLKLVLRAFYVSSIKNFNLMLLMAFLMG
nr:MAG TPA: hypothetical protein [Caudoviricetes sp.]